MTKKQKELLEDFANGLSTFFLKKMSDWIKKHPPRDAEEEYSPEYARAKAQAASDIFKEWAELKKNSSKKY